MKFFPNYKQLDAMDCNPICLRIIAKYYGRGFFVQYLRGKSFIIRESISMLGISDAAETIGIRTNGIKITFEQLVKEKPLPFVYYIGIKTTLLYAIPLKRKET